MLVKNCLLFVLLGTLAVSVCAETYWLNMPASYSEKYHESTPSVSLPLADYAACQDALLQSHSIKCPYPTIIKTEISM